MRGARIAASMILKPDCSHFPGDRPCSFHKSTGVKCDSCPHYSPVRHKILVIKFDALGDVLVGIVVGGDLVVMLLGDLEVAMCLGCAA